LNIYSRLKSLLTYHAVKKKRSIWWLQNNLYLIIMKLIVCQ
jgi:hypothetical protein